jgi:EAL domain-containing protein (putative c-di-GMP-specific phosphodiesterase class I)
LTSTDGPLVDFDGVCAQVRTAIDPIRAHAISLHDETGELLWLSESAMGPDEHNAVREAIERFRHPQSPELSASDLGDSRSALLIRAASPQRHMAGVIMVVVDSRHVAGDARGSSRLMTPALRGALAHFAAMRAESESPPLELMPDPPPAAPAVQTARAERPSASQIPDSGLSIAPSAPLPSLVAPAVSSPKPKTPPPAPAARAAQPPAPPPAPPPADAAPAAPRKIRPANGPVTPELDRLHNALRRAPIALHLQRLVPLAKGSRARRYEVLLRSAAGDAPGNAPLGLLKIAVERGLGSMIDRRVVTELIGWLIRHPAAWRDHGIMFSVNLTTTALHDEHFFRFVGLCLVKAGLPKAMIGFEIDVNTAVKPSTNIVNVANALHKLGCPLILDDFAMRTECFDLLRLPAVKIIKMGPAVTANMRTDKLAQAEITALVQMARVLGMHTVAKHTESSSEREWLTALGVDFVQSNALSPAVSIESLTPAASRKK